MLWYLDIVECWFWLRLKNWCILISALDMDLATLSVKVFVEMLIPYFINLRNIEGVFFATSWEVALLFV